MKLILCVSQQENTTPYRFSGTGIQVYTFEEVLYHVYHYWKQSVDDITSPHLTSWIHDSLELSFLAAKIKDIALMELFSQRMLAFLGIVDYFSKKELEELKPHLERWEKRLEWETYKERADDLVERGEPDKAIPLYRRALQFDENIPVLNNLSVAYMQVENYEDACRYLKQALKLEQHLDKNPDNGIYRHGRKNSRQLLLHYAEALIHAGRLEEGAATIDSAAAISPEKANGDILYLRGELSLRKGQFPEAISYFEQAVDLSDNISSKDQYVFRLSDAYISKRQFEKALEILAEYIPNREQNLLCLVKEAELHHLVNNLHAAIQSVKKAIEIKPNYIELWVRLAKYHCLNYDLPKAEEAVSKALSLDASNERARLESARIKKGMGHTKAYQQLLKGILAEFKGRYREAH